MILLGARSFVALPLLPKLLAKGYQVQAVSRQPEKLPSFSTSAYSRLALDELRTLTGAEFLISLMPIWETATLYEKLRLGVSRAVVLSSSSITNKKSSRHPRDKALVEQLEEAEAHLRIIFGLTDTSYLILRPSLVFGYGKDKNLSLILSSLKRYRIMPYMGPAKGLRQPIHAEDLAEAILLALESSHSDKQIAIGGLPVAYDHMIELLAEVNRVSYLPLHLPRALIRAGLSVIKLLPRYRFIDVGMFERMNEDLLVDICLAQDLLGYQPRTFKQMLGNHKM